MAEIKRADIDLVMRRDKGCLSVTFAMMKTDGNILNYYTLDVSEEDARVFLKQALKELE